MDEAFEFIGFSENFEDPRGTQGTASRLINERGLVIRWSHGIPGWARGDPFAQRAHGLWGPWALGPMCFGAHGLWGPWALGPMGLGAHGPWGPMGPRGALGTLGARIISVGPRYSNHLTWHYSLNFIDPSGPIGSPGLIR